jgi:pimeloyl-ACP methyl ester carboxylesterase
VHVFYLHGFASSARSTKAAYFAERFRERGVPFWCPDFNEPDFATLTLTRMIEQVERRMPGLDAPIVLMGSSLGGVVALHVASRRAARVARLVLMAPALRFGKDGHAFLGPERVARWRDTRTLDVFHYGYGAPRPLNFSFYEDSLRYDAEAADVRRPTLIFQGLHDTSVPHEIVERYAAVHDNVTLRLLNDDHQLITSLPAMWVETCSFLSLT